MYQSEAQKWLKKRGFRPRTNALKPFLKAEQSPNALFWPFCAFLRIFGLDFCADFYCIFRPFLSAFSGSFSTPKNTPQLPPKVPPKLPPDLRLWRRAA